MLKDDGLSKKFGSDGDGNPSTILEGIVKLALQFGVNARGRK
jgi:hypothetical protein